MENGQSLLFACWAISQNLDPCSVCNAPSIRIPVTKLSSIQMNPDFWCLVFRYLLVWITVSPLFRLVLTTAYIMLKPEYQTCSLFRLHLHVASVQQQMVEVCMKHSRLIDLAKTNYYKMVQVTTTNQLDDQVLQWSRKFMLSQKLSRRFCDIFHLKCETNLLILL